MKKTKFDIFVSVYSWIVVIVILSIVAHIFSNIYNLRKIELTKVDSITQTVVKQTSNVFDHQGEIEAIKVDTLLRNSPQLTYLAASIDDQVVFTASNEASGLLKYREGSFISNIFYRQMAEQTLDSSGRILHIDFIIRLINNKDFASFIENDIIIILSLLIFTISLAIVLLFIQHNQNISKMENRFSLKEKNRAEDDAALVDSNYNPFLHDKEVVDFFAVDQSASNLDSLDHPIDITFDDMNLEEDDENFDLEILDDSMVGDDFSLDPLEVEELSLDLDDDLLNSSDDLEFIDNLPALDENDEAFFDDVTWEGDNIDINIPEDEPVNRALDEGKMEDLIATLLINHAEMSIVCFENSEYDSAFENDAKEFFMQQGNINVEVFSDSFLVALTDGNEQNKIKIVKQFTEQMKRSGNNVSCGIASTYQRKIKAHLLLREATVALEEAKVREDNKIVLFKPNIESYKNIFYL